MRLEVKDGSSKKQWIVFIVAIVLAVVAAILSGQYLDHKEEEMRQSLVGKKQVKLRVVVPRLALLPGDIISDQNVVVREIPKEFIPDGAFSPKQFSVLAGRTVIHGMSAGKPLLESRLSSVGIEQFSDLLEDGQRAITLPMDEFNSTAGMLVAGDKIDLFLLAKKSKITGRKSREQKKERSSALYLLLENVTILATGKSTIEDRSIEQIQEAGFAGYGTITLGVALRDAGRIGLARKDGDFIAMLKNRKDLKRVTVPYLDSADLYSRVVVKDRDIEFIIGGASQNGITGTNLLPVEIDELESQLEELEEAGQGL